MWEIESILIDSNSIHPQKPAKLSAYTIAENIRFLNASMNPSHQRLTTAIKKAVLTILSAKTVLLINNKATAA